MDARIGQLMRDGGIVHYAFVSGRAQAVEGSLEVVEAALGLRQPFAPAPVIPAARSVAKRILRTYEVTVTPSTVVHVGGWQSGAYTLDIDAHDRSDAIKAARRGWTEDVAIGVPATFRAHLKAN